MKLNSAKLRKMDNPREGLEGLRKKDIYIVLDNVLDTYNVGAVFRLADAAAAKRIYLCGYTETPPNSRIKKASINTWQLTDWEHFNSAGDAIKSLKTDVPGIKVIGVEQIEKSINYTDADYSFPIALVIGNETHGISSEALKLCEQIVELPMFGVNVSLNTMVSLAIVLYKALEKNP